VLRCVIRKSFFGVSRRRFCPVGQVHRASSRERARVRAARFAFFGECVKQGVSCNSARDARSIDAIFATPRVGDERPFGDLARGQARAKKS
jgi:hypothetical protein